MKRIVALITALSLSVISAFLPYAAEETNVVRSVSSSKKQIALTFDDGPHFKYTEEILEILSIYNVKATFFVIGENAEKYPRIVEREIDEGHEVGNHTYKHVYLKGKCEEEIKSQISSVETVLADTCDYTPKLLRPPGGLYDVTLSKEAAKMGYTVVLWSVDTVDWSHPTVESIVENVKKEVDGGDIILMHDFIGGAKSPTPDALRAILPELINEGYEFVTVSELIASEKLENR